MFCICFSYYRSPRSPPVHPHHETLGEKAMHLAEGAVKIPEKALHLASSVVTTFEKNSRHAAAIVLWALDTEYT